MIITTAPARCNPHLLTKKIPILTILSYSNGYQNARIKQTHMSRRIIHSYPARLLFVIGAIAAAFLIVNYRLFIKRDSHLLRANRTRLN